AGYERVDAIEYPGQFASRGGIIDIFPPSGPGGEQIPVRLDFFGDEIDSIAEIDLDTMGSDRAVGSVLLGAVGEAQLAATRDDRSVLEYLPEGTLVLLAETFEVVEQGRGYYERLSSGGTIFGPPAVLKLLETRFHALAEVNQFSAGKSGADQLVSLPVETLPPFDKEVSIAIRELAELRERVDTVVLACGSDGEFARLGELLTMHAPEADIRREILDIRRGYIWESSDPGAGVGRYAIVPAGQMLHRSSVRRRMQKIRAGRAMDTFLDIQPDDYVVHTEHGIAKFVGLTVMDASGTAKTREKYSLKPERAGKKRREDQEEYLTLEFAGRSRLHV
ncbi:MAG TPA: CarD family transcriptional regulator, partial [Myxococcota bacterium]|nr:CarD family transcriptional regulator [Myxococcota bacterium]